MIDRHRPESSSHGRPHPGLLLAWALLLLSSGLASTALAARDPKAAKAAVDAASQAMSAKRYDEAALQMELAYGFDPNPLWLANAGYARMMAAEPDKAVELLSRAIADTKLQGDGRTRAVERLGKASAAKAFVDSSEKAGNVGDFKVAARAMDEAFGIVSIGTYALEAGLLWEKAKQFTEAEARFTTALSMQDLKPEQQARATASLARVARLAGMASGEKDPRSTGPLADEKGQTPDLDPEGQPPVPDERDPGAPMRAKTEANSGEGSSVLAWVLVGSGVAVAGGGATLWFLGEDRASVLRDVHEAAREGVVTQVTRMRAQTLASEAETFRTAGVIGTIAGLALTTTGVVLVAMESGSDGQKSVVQVGADIRPTRWMLTAGWRW
jgi:tetratricopeptide (TPR) repeat protein